jgi:hypothetical protein
VNNSGADVPAAMKVAPATLIIILLKKESTY